MSAKSVIGLLLFVAIAAQGGGCETKAGTGALVGGLGGAAVGGAIGSMSHSRAGEGALIGGAIGAIGGALIGHGMDQQDRRDSQLRNREMAAAATVTKEDVIAWTARGVKDEIIIDRIEQSRTVFHLTAADENQLRDARVSEVVIRAMRATARR